MDDSARIAALERRVLMLEGKIDTLIRLLKRSDDQDVEFAARRANNA